MGNVEKMRAYALNNERADEQHTTSGEFIFRLHKNRPQMLDMLQHQVDDHHVHFVNRPFAAHIA